MNIWPAIGTGLACALAPLAQKYVMQPFVRTLKRYWPNWLLKKVLFFEIGERDRNRPDGKPLKSLRDDRSNRRTYS